VARYVEAIAYSTMWLGEDQKGWTAASTAP